MAPKRKAISKGLRFDIFKRDGFTCQYCGEQPPGVVLHIDHILPVVEGGNNRDANLVTSCAACNMGKGQKILNHLRRPPNNDLLRQLKEFWIEQTGIHCPFDDEERCPSS